MAAGSGPVTELIPLRMYYQRHNRYVRQRFDKTVSFLNVVYSGSLFWALKDQIPICNNALFRLLLGWILPPRVAFLKLVESDSVTKWYENQYVAQDWLVPLDHMQEGMQVLDKELKIYPLWLCPHRVYNTAPYQGKLRAGSTNKAGEYQHYVDLATIGEPGNKTTVAPLRISAVEEYMISVGE